MKTVFLTSGPRGAGKTTYVSLVKKVNPEVLVVDRDDLYIREFGATSFNAYSERQMLLKSYSMST